MMVVMSHEESHTFGNVLCQRNALWRLVQWLRIRLRREHVRAEIAEAGKRAMPVLLSDLEHYSRLLGDADAAVLDARCREEEMRQRYQELRDAVLYAADCGLQMYRDHDGKFSAYHRGPDSIAVDHNHPAEAIVEMLRNDGWHYDGEDER
jgi:hypothetical protein